MRKNRFDRKIEKYIFKILDASVKKYGLSEVKHSASKWVNGMRERSALLKAQREVQKKLVEISQRLKK